MTPKTPGYFVLVKPDTLHEYDPVFQSAKKSGIVIQEATERKELTGVDTGIVVDVGPIAWHEFAGEPWAKIGDRVSYVKHGGKFVTNPTDKEEKWLLINDVDVCMVWSE